VSRWLFDLGNTRLKAAPLHDDGRIGEAVAITHWKSADDGAALGAGLAEHLPPRIEIGYLASVADTDLRGAVMQLLASRCRRICVARSSRRWNGLRIAYDEPSRLGVDRFLAMLAAHAGANGAALVCGVGTALTVDLVDADGGHRGGRIAPSPTLMREALHQRAAQLPVAGGEYRDFADDTLDALASGCEGAALGLIERSVARAETDLGSAPTLILHGGGAAALAARLPRARLAPDLVLEGLARWAALDWRG